MKAIFPRAVNLTVPNRTLRFEAGLNEVPDSLIGHWWLKANGVVIQTSIRAPDKPAPSPLVRFPYLHALSRRINKLELETEAKARGIIEKDIVEAYTQKAAVLEQVRGALKERRDAMRDLAVKLELSSFKSRTT